MDKQTESDIRTKKSAQGYGTAEQEVHEVMIAFAILLLSGFNGWHLNAEMSLVGSEADVEVNKSRRLA